MKYLKYDIKMKEIHAFYLQNKSLKVILQQKLYRILPEF